MISDKQARRLLTEWCDDALTPENLLDLSRQLGIDVKSLRNYRDGKSWPTGPKLLRLSAALNEPLPKLK